MTSRLFIRSAPVPQRRPAPHRLRSRALSAFAAACVVAAVHGCASANRSGLTQQPGGWREYLADAGNRELTPEEQVRHVIARLTFGARPGDEEKVRSAGIESWIALQLSPERIPDFASDAMALRYSGPPVPAVDPGGAASLRKTEWTRVVRAVSSERQLYEMMVEFWSNHFSVYAGKPQVRPRVAAYDAVTIRPHALGKFRGLLGAVARSPAMLLYLDNAQNAADGLHPTLTQLRVNPTNANIVATPQTWAACVGRGGPGAPAWVAQLPPETRKLMGTSTPIECARIVQPYVQRASRGLPIRPAVNENFARELFELHTMGVDGGYTQADVSNAARAFTGWSAATLGGAGFVFRDDMHDATEKYVLGKVIQQRRGIEDGEEILDMLARHPSTARHITTKIARRFISDDPPPSVVDRCSRAFLDSDGDIRTTLACVIGAPEFFSRAAYRSKVKTPFELVVSAIRAVDGEPDGRPGLAQPLVTLGQPLYGRQTPDGWPDRGEDWMNSGAIVRRINFGLAIAGRAVTGVMIPPNAGLQALQDSTREVQAEAIIRTVLGAAASAETRRILTTGEHPLLISSMPDTPPGATVRVGSISVQGGGFPPVVLRGYSQMLGLALGSPEFQRR